MTNIKPNLVVKEAISKLARIQELFEDMEEEEGGEGEVEKKIESPEKAVKTEMPRNSIMLAMEQWQQMNTKEDDRRMVVDLSDIKNLVKISNNKIFLECKYRGSKVRTDHIDKRNQFAFNQSFTL